MQTKLMTALAMAAAALFVAGQAHADGDAAKGKVIFKRCELCHSPEKGVNKVGPSLFGVVGRPSASIKNFDYSDAMKAKHITWTPENLNTWLTKPSAFVPGTKMLFPGLQREKDRQNVIAYLKTLK